MNEQLSTVPSGGAGEDNGFKQKDKPIFGLESPAYPFSAFVGMYGTHGFGLNPTSCHLPKIYYEGIIETCTIHDN